MGPFQTSIKQAFHEIIGHLIEGGSGINITEQFRPDDSTRFSVLRNMNAAFLIALSGERHPGYEGAKEYLEEAGNDPRLETPAKFFQEGLELIPAEFRDYCAGNGKIEKLVKRARKELVKPKPAAETQELLWSLFHPEASGVLDHKESQENSLRQRRKIRITHLNSEPIKNVANEVLFTANALFTIPSSKKRLEELGVSSGLKEILGEVMREEQIFWYDHPVQIGVVPEKNEILYGLTHLSEALLYEKKAGNVENDAEITCLLSASVTHKGLQGVVKQYVEYELTKARKLSGLKVFLFTEADTERLIGEILVPAAMKYMDRTEDTEALLREVFGVDGRYGRHYSFLKAIAAFWNVFVDPAIRGTFKIDLDQVFPQERLVQETEKTAFEHLMSPLWGATGVDSEGTPVVLGMIAGALVNGKDVPASLFTPDVPYPLAPFKGEDTVFCSTVPQALSTVSEMMTFYNDKIIDGKNSCIQRVHVTGGTTGILINALRKYRPFTPTFIGRAEDQAYLLSVLSHSDKGPVLRYAHLGGLFMSHDKKSFAGEAIRNAAIGKVIGDYERILLFSSYAKILDRDLERIKRTVDPFTGSFISPISLILAYLRLALKAAEVFSADEEEENIKGVELIETGSKRLQSAIRELIAEDGKGLQEKYEREKRAWDLFYDILDKAEDALQRGDSFALELQEKAARLVQNMRIVTGEGGTAKLV